MNIEIIYKENGKKKKITESQSEVFSLSVSEIKGGKRYVGVFSPKAQAEIVKAEIVLPIVFCADDKIMMNGYQSWTRSREKAIDGKEKDMSLLAKCLEFKYKFKSYGDGFFYTKKVKKGVIHSHSFTYVKSGENYRFYGSINETNAYAIFETNVSKNEIRVLSDVSGLVVKGKRTLFDFIVTNGAKDEVFDEFFDLLKVEKKNLGKMKGFTSWYNYYQNINEEIILKNLDNFRSFKNRGNRVDVFQIDDGFEEYVGDWLKVDKVKFPNGLKDIAKEIRKDFKAGLWLAPFVCETKSELFKVHKDWLLKDKSGRYVKAGSNWSGFYALDFYNNDFREYLKQVFKTVFTDWGFNMVKLDFLYAAALQVPKDKTRGEVMREAMEFIRGLCGDNTVLGCGVPLSSAYGLVDYCRIGCDVSLDFDGGILAKLIHSECVSTLDDIADSVSRFPLNGRAFMNDPDVILLRSDNIKMNKQEKHALSVANAVFGGVLFTSDDLSKYESKEVLEDLESVWRLNDAEVKSYEIIDELFYKAVVLADNAQKTVYINLSDDIYVCDKYVIDKRSAKIV